MKRLLVVPLVAAVAFAIYWFASLISIAPWAARGYAVGYFADYQSFYISRFGGIVVDGYVLDYDWYDGYFVGLRLPAGRYECRESSSTTEEPMLKMGPERKRTFFIFDTRQKQLVEFDADFEFKKMMSELKIERHISLNYDRFREAEQQYSGLFDEQAYSGCVAIAD